MRAVCRLLMCVVLILFLNLSACVKKVYYPEYGIWYCEALQTQTLGSKSVPDDWSPVDNDESGIYVIISGEKIACNFEGYPGSVHLWITCMETENETYEFGEIIYSFEFVSLSDSEYVLTDEDEKEYIFVRKG